MMPQGMMGYGGMTTGGGFYQPTMPGYGGMMVSMCICMYMCVHVYTCMCVHVCTCVYVCVYVCVCVCVCVHVCVCMCTCLCINLINVLWLCMQMRNVSFTIHLLSCVPVANAAWHVSRYGGHQLESTQHDDGIADATTTTATAKTAVLQQSARSIWTH